MGYLFIKSLTHEFSTDKIEYGKIICENMVYKVNSYGGPENQNARRVVENTRLENFELYMLDSTYVLMASSDDFINRRDKIFRFDNREFVENDQLKYSFKDDKIKVIKPIINNKNDTLGYLYVEGSTEDINKKLEDVIKIFAYVFSFTLLLATIIANLLAENITVPIEKLNEAFKNMSRGKLFEKIDYRGKNELGSLCYNFNIMSTKISQIEEQRTEFVSNVSHELKTPLSSMKLLGEALLYGEPQHEEVYREFLKDITGEVDRLNKIIEELMELVDLNKGHLTLNTELIYLNYLIRGIVKIMKPYGEARGIEILLEEESKIQLKIDSLKIERVFTNLLDNSIKYGRENSKVRITIEKEDGFAIVSVQDEGIGIPAEDIEKIFDRFYRVDKARSRKTGGSGLGLAMVKQIVDLHQGDISVASFVNQGSRFVVRIPLDLD